MKAYKYIIVGKRLITAKESGKQYYSYHAMTDTKYDGNIYVASFFHFTDLKLNDKVNLIFVNGKYQVIEV